GAADRAVQGLAGHVAADRNGGSLTAASRRPLGYGLAAVASVGLAGAVAVQTLHAAGAAELGFEDWRPVGYAYVAWAVATAVAQVLVRGERGLRALFLLPAVLYTV